MKSFLLVVMFSFSASWAFGGPSEKDIQFYRDLTLKTRSSTTFKVPMPSGNDMIYDYNLKMGDPIYEKPMVSDYKYDVDQSKFTRIFYDRILLKDGSFVKIGGEMIPLTCIFIDGQDNRFAENSLPTFPQFVMRVYLVANDYSCTGPINPGWPDNGGKEETWDTYVYFEIRDPTIMLPVEAHLRYRWNEYKSVLVK